MTSPRAKKRLPQSQQSLAHAFPWPATQPQGDEEDEEDKEQEDDSTEEEGSEGEGGKEKRVRD